MTKKFLEVFPELHITSEMEDLLKLVDVERVSASKNRSSIRIYIVSPRLIHKKNLYDLENGIKSQLFPNKQLEIRIIEKYHLSGQYTPEKLLNVYKDSLLLELKNYSILLYNILRKAECTFPKENILSMTVEDNPVLKQKTGELKRVLEKVFCERCGLPVEINTQKQKKTGKAPSGKHSCSGRSKSGCATALWLQSLCLRNCHPDKHQT